MENIRMAPHTQTNTPGGSIFLSISDTWRPENFKPFFQDVFTKVTLSQDQNVTGATCLELTHLVKVLLNKHLAQ